MTLLNSNVPTARRAALTDRVEQLKRMLEIRAVEERIQKLFSEGEVRGSTHLANGQEAVAVGIARVTRPDDIVTCTYRGHGHALALGATPVQVIGEICGRSVGCAGGLGGSMHLVEPSVGLMPTFAIVGAGLPIACGAALAAKARKTDRVAVAIFGDGSTNIGAFHESLNFAAIQKLPVIFICENNLYGEYSALAKTTPVTDIAVRAASYAIPGVIVDGQDVDAVAAAVETAVARARKGEGPTLIEMKTYRYSGHSRSDPATYRPAGELDAWKKRDPIDLLAAKLVGEGLIKDGELDTLRTGVIAEVEDGTKEVLASPQPAEIELLSHITAASPGGRSALDFLVEIEVRWPADGDPDRLAVLAKAESERAAELADQGILVRLWRIPGCRANVGLWRANDATELHAALSSLPLFPWIEAEVRPLADHPNDPARRD